jgi:hypothetical protein
MEFCKEKHRFIDFATFLSHIHEISFRLFWGSGSIGSAGDFTSLRSVFVFTLVMLLSVSTKSIITSSSLCKLDFKDAFNLSRIVSSSDQFSSKFVRSGESR